MTVRHKMPLTNSQRSETNKLTQFPIKPIEYIANCIKLHRSGRVNRFFINSMALFKMRETN